MIMVKKGKQTVLGTEHAFSHRKALLQMFPSSTSQGFTENCHLLQTEHPYRAERHSVTRGLPRSDKCNNSCGISNAINIPFGD
jgi:hypothetical protein